MLKPLELQKKRVMSKMDLGIYYVLCFVGLLLTLVFTLWWFEPAHIPSNFIGRFHLFDFLIFAIVSYVVFYQIVHEVFSWVSVYFMEHPVYMLPEMGKKVAFLTAFVPGKEPYDVLENTLQAMKKVAYKHDTWLLDEGDDEEAKRLCKMYGVFHYTRKCIAKYNTENGQFKAKTKAGNYNSWYDKFGKSYDFVAQVDVDFPPKKDFLVKTLGYFKDPSVAFVGSPQVYGNTDESWIAKGAAEQAYGFHGSLQKSFFGHDMTLFIGANHVVRVAAHDSIDGYSGHIVEDHLTGMKFYTKGWKSVYVPEILAVGEGPATWDSYFSQQMRWAYGLFHILFHESPKLFKKMKPIHVINYFVLQQYYFLGFVQALGVLLITLFFLFGIQATPMRLTELLILGLPLVIIQQVMFLWTQKFNIDPENESGLMLRPKLLTIPAWPIYLLALISVVSGKRLTYKVTPKGKQQHYETKLLLFLPHFVFGTLTAVDIISSLEFKHFAPQILFWAELNTFFMYYFVGSVLFNNLLLKLKSPEWQMVLGRLSLKSLQPTTGFVSID